MCQMPIGKVTKVENGKITVLYKGKARLLDSKLVDVKVGGYVAFAANMAIEAVEKDGAWFVGVG